MKILWRTLIILVAVAVVTGATLGAMQVPAIQTWIESQGGGHGGPPEMFEAGTEAAGAETAAIEDSDDAAAASTALLAAASDEDAAAATGAATTTTGTATRPMRGEGGDHNSGGNLYGLFEVVKNFGIVVVASLAIAAVGWVGKRLRPQRRSAAAAI